MTGRLGPPEVHEPNDNRWMEHAECKGTDPELFHPHRGEMGALRSAQRVCSECPVASECLEWALIVPDTRGVWGGLSEDARARMRRARGLTQNTCAICGHPFTRRADRQGTCGAIECKRQWTYERRKEQRRQKREQERAS